MNETIMIHGCPFAADLRSDATTEETRRDEDLHFAARDTLERIRTSKTRPVGYEDAPWQGMLMLAYKPVAQFYGVDPNALLKVWTAHYGPGILTELLKKPVSTIEMQAEDAIQWDDYGDVDLAATVRAIVALIEEREKAAWNAGHSAGLTEGRRT